MGRLFSLYVPEDEDRMSTEDAITLIRGVGLASVFSNSFEIGLDQLHDHYGVQLTGGAFANLLQPLLFDAMRV